MTGLVCLSACGSQAGPVDENDEGLKKVVVGYSSPGASYSDLYVAIEKGIFETNGLDVELKELNSSSQLVPALTSGSVQIGAGSGTESAAAILQGNPLRYIALARPVYNLEVWAAPDVGSVDGLRGRKIGLTSPGSQSDSALTDFLEDNGMTRDDIEPVFLKSIEGQITGLQSGAVDAILTQPPQGKVTESRGFERLASLADLPFPSGAYVTSEEFLDQNEEVVDAFVASEVEALETVHSDREATVAAIQKYSGEEDKALAEYAYDFFVDVWATDPTVDKGLMKDAFEQAATETGESMPTDVGEYIDNTFVESHLKETGS